MADEQRILQILETMLDTGQTPAEACAGDPTLLAAVNERWNRLRLVESELDALFPTPHSAPNVQNKARRAIFGVLGADGELPRIPGYEVQSVLGRGGMGVVYKAWHVKLKRPVAIKMLLAGAFATEQELECLLREAQVVAGLRHPNIVQVHDVGELNGLPYFSMEFVEGGTLAQKLAGVPQPAKDAAALAVTLADAVQAAHKGGVVHRDLKPANILLTSEGSPKVADFSLARTFGPESAITLNGARIGTPGYMAPEQVMGTPAAFYPSVDIYALGAILYEALTGRPPFRAETPELTHRQVLAAEPVPPSRLNPGVPRDLDTISLKCLQKEPAHRYPAAAALVDDLRRFLAGEPIRARPASLWERTWRLARRNRAATALIVAITLLIALATFAVLREWRAEVIQRGEDARWADRLASVVALQQQGRLAEVRPILLGGSTSVSDEMKRRIDAARADLAVAERLDAVRLNRGKFTQGGGIDYTLSCTQYAAAFRDARLGEIGEPPDRAAARLSTSPIRAAIVAALDDWAACADAAERPWILDVVRRLDPDPWRDRVRDNDRWADLDLIADAAATVDVDRHPVSLLVALGTRWRRLGGDPTAFLERVQRRHPDDFWANFELGHLHSARRPAVAIAYCRAAIAARPHASPAHYNLGVNLRAVGQVDEASEHFTKTLAIEPDHTWARFNLARCLASLGRLTEAAREMGKARAAAPDHPDMWRELRAILLRQRRVEEARADWRRWLDHPGSSPEDLHGYAELCLLAGNQQQYHAACDELLSRFGASDDPRTCERTGRACLLLPASDQRVMQAASLIDRALASDPDRYEAWARPYFVVAKALAEYRAGRPERAIALLQGDAATSLGPVPALLVAMSNHRLGHTAEARRSLAQAAQMFDWRGGYDVDVAVTYNLLRAEAEALIVPDLPAFFEGRYQPSDNDERLAMLGACAAHDRAAAAAALYSAAFASDPSLTSDITRSLRYNAACAAVRAGCGHAADAPSNATERTRLRASAMDWLRADLAVWTAHLDARDPLGGEPLKRALAHWREDEDLASVRNPAALSKLPSAEQERWRSLWSDVQRIAEGR